jgi:hypothetical protein
MPQVFKSKGASKGHHSLRRNGERGRNRIRAETQTLMRSDGAWINLRKLAAIDLAFFGSNRGRASASASCAKQLVEIYFD